MQHAIRRTVLLAAMAGALLCLTVSAEVPPIMTFQGKLTDSAGHYLHGHEDLTFRIYDRDTGGAVLWQEEHANATVTRGVFAVPLGVHTPLNLTFSTNYWVSIEVADDGEMSPRQRLTSAPYAFRAATAGRADEANQLTGGLGPALHLLMRDYVRGCQLEYASPTSLVVRTGVVSCRSGSTYVAKEITTAILLTLGGGAPAPETWHGVYLICDGTDGGLVSAVDVPYGVPVPGGYSRRIGWVHTDASAQIDPFYQHGVGSERTYMWAKANMVTGDTFVNIPAGGWSTPFDLSTFVPPESTTAFLFYQISGGTFRIRRNATDVAAYQLWCSEVSPGRTQTTSGWITTGTDRTIQFGPTLAKTDAISVVYCNAFKDFL
jgi:hypothetical protein